MHPLDFKAAYHGPKCGSRVSFDLIVALDQMLAFNPATKVLMPVVILVQNSDDLITRIVMCDDVL